MDCLFLKKVHPLLTVTTSFHKKLAFQDKCPRECYVCRREHLK